MFGLASALRVGSAVAAVLALAGALWWAYDAGREAVMLRWQADVLQRTEQALAAERANRAHEATLAENTRRIANALADEKTRRAAADRAAADSLRRLDAVLAADRGAPGADTASAGGADGADPRSGIIAECAGALAEMDRAYRAVAATARGLQDYTARVCVGPQE